MPARPRLSLDPTRCDRCGRCADVCPSGALEIGPSYIFVDWPRCDGCGACVEVCETGAIVQGAARRFTLPKRPAPAAPPPARAAAGGVPWSVPEVVAVFAVAALLLVAKDALAGSAFARDLTVSGQILLNVAVQGVYYGSLVALLVWLVRRRGLPFRESFALTRFPALSSVAWVLASVVALLALRWMYGEVAQALGWDPSAATSNDLPQMFGADIPGLALATLMVVVAGPFVEELVFRGMLLRVAVPYTGRWVAIVGSAVVFAGSHLSLWRFLPLTLLGVALGWLAVSRDSLWPCIGLHALYNGVWVLAGFYLAGAL